MSEENASGAGAGETPQPQLSLEPEINWQQKCIQLEHQISVLREASALRKNLLEIRGTETKSLIMKLKVLEEAINEEKSCRLELTTRMSTAELECQNVKDKLRRNMQTLERMRQENEAEVNSLMSNLETSELRCKEQSSELGDAKRINAELRGQLEELNMKLHENRKFTKGLEIKLKISSDRNEFLGNQVNLINELLVEKALSPPNSPGDEELSLHMQEKIKTILRQQNLEVKDHQRKSVVDEDEGVELSSLIETMEDNGREDVADIPGEESCYKTVDTKRGPQSILSVSRTYIKLKDLILEKKSLEKEIDNLKNLNTKLESKVDKQEHRLYCVTKELNKTWTLVSKLKLQHDKLHNSESVLKYELKEKRALLERLKKELLSYRDKWRKVREKNKESQSVWQELRDEFAQRRQQDSLASTSSSSGGGDEGETVNSGLQQITTPASDLLKNNLNNRRPSNS